MLFVLVLIGSLIALVAFAFVVARNVEHGEARFDSKTGRQISHKTGHQGPAIPARRIEQNTQENERETDHD